MSERDHTTLPWPDLPPILEARLELRMGARTITLGQNMPRAIYGRDELNDFTLGDDFASRRHGEIAFREGKFVLTDASRNGTLVVREHAPTLYVHRESVVLENEGEVRLGRIEGAGFTFRVEVLMPGSSEWQTAWSLAPVQTRSPSGNVFRREGEYWTIAYDGVVLRMKSTRGLELIGHLLRAPGRDLHAIDLAQMTADDGDPATPNVASARDDQLSIGGGGGLGAQLDGRARNEYRRRIAELREELGEAEEFNDRGRVERLGEEIAIYEREIACAVGLGGRERPVGSAAERARVTVTVRIKKTLAKIKRCHPGLGHHLTTTIKTGRCCSYCPDPTHPISWSL